MTATVTPTMNTLCQLTSVAWLEQALGNIDTILLDHSHCERKAAGTAINLMFRYPSNTKLVRQLTAIAREELEHFDRVNHILEQRNIALAPLNAPPYAKGLMSQVRTQEPHRCIRSSSFWDLLATIRYLFRSRYRPISVSRTRNRRKRFTFDALL